MTYDDLFEKTSRRRLTKSAGIHGSMIAMNAAQPSGPTSQLSSPDIGSPTLSIFRRFSRRAWWLHGLLIAQIILLPCPQPSQAVWIDVDSDGDGLYDTGYDDGTPPPMDGTTDTSTTASAAPAYDPTTTDSDGDYLMDSEEMAAGSNIIVFPYNFQFPVLRKPFFSK